MIELSKYSEELIAKASKIKALFFDVDGVLTDGKIIYNNEGMETKEFNVKDGQIIQHLRNAKILTGVITGRDAQVVRNRCEELKIDLHHHGVKEKGKLFDQLLQEHGLQPQEVAYIGDDINDLPILTKCGLSATPADGHYQVKSRVGLVLKQKGGYGALRELADLILEAQGRYEEMIKDILK